MVEDIKNWIRSNFFSKKDLHDNGALDSRYYTETEVDAIGAVSTTHIAATEAHGATGAVVGTTNSQVLTNKTLTAPVIGDFTGATHTHQSVAQAGQLDHGLAITGLADDDHTQYALLAGRAGGQTLKGGTAASDGLTLQSTTNATKGKVLVGTSGYDEVNNRLGVKTASPSRALQVAGTVYISANDAPFTTSAYGKALEIGTDNAIQWLKGGGSISRAIAHGADGTFRFIRSTADDASAAAVEDVTIDSSGNIAFNARVGTAWAGVTYTSGWGDFDGAWQGAQYKKVGDLVFLRGLCKRSSGSSAIMFTLPSGYRPPIQLLFPQVSFDLIARVDVQSSGDVVLSGGSPTVWANVGGIVFSTL